MRVNVYEFVMCMSYLLYKFLYVIMVSPLAIDLYISHRDKFRHFGDGLV